MNTRERFQAIMNFQLSFRTLERDLMPIYRLMTSPPGLERFLTRVPRDTK